MQYNFPIKPLSCSSYLTGNSSIQELGRIGSTIWKLRPQWRNSNYIRLTSVEIFRNDENLMVKKDKAFRVDIELHLHCCRSASEYENSEYEGYEDSIVYGEPFNCSGSRPSKLFKTTLLQGAKSCIIPTDFYYEPGYQYHGYIVLYSSSPCMTGIQNAASRDPSELSNDFLRLLDNPSSFADAKIKCETAEIPVHKCILSVRSPVLAAMFSSQMQEGLSSTLLITDIKLDVLQATLKYIYGGKTDNLTDVLAGDMLFAADKYQLDKLKLICIAKLKSSVTRDNIFRILVLGELHDKGLKTHAIDFLCRCDQFSDLEETEEWTSLEKEYPGLAMEVVKTIVKFVQQAK